MNPLVSIIVPIYNSEKTIDRCINSILNQKYKNFELILIDDGSVDKSLQICNDYKNNDNRLVVISQQNYGVSRARNQGLQVAKGEILSFVDSDDYIEEDFYQYLVMKLVSSGADVIALSKYTIRKQSNFLNKTIDSEKAKKKLLLLEMPTSVWAYLYKADVIQKKFFSEEIHFFEDLLFNFNVLNSTLNIQLDSYEGYHYIFSPQSANGSELSLKKFSCLLIPYLIKDETVKKECLFFKAHCLVSLILSLSKSRNPSLYLNRVSNECKEIRISKNRNIPLKYKVLIYGTAFFPKFFIKFLRVLRGG
ncbi:glycosyltransferase family 2 protein [Enterococcus mundtii]|uniref:glycosyltransferase family 2 protein n=1 Tax=Enterococcus mundtii TaxID=53346 RepID=UPI00397088D6